MEVLPPDAGGQFQIISANVPRVRLLGYRVEPADWPQFLAARELLWESPGGADRILDREPIIDQTLRLETSAEGLTITTLDLQPLAAGRQGPSGACAGATGPAAVGYRELPGVGAVDRTGAGCLCRQPATRDLGDGPGQRRAVGGSLDHTSTAGGCGQNGCCRQGRVRAIGIGWRERFSPVA